MGKEEKKKSDAKLSPKDKKDDVKSKARLLMMKHPEVLYNAKNLFHNENGETIIEERVPRGDAKKEDVIMPRNQGDLTDKDLREMAVYASSLVDDTLKQYDQVVAYEDALQRAIGTKDNGKYAGKINASTFALILENMGKSKKSASEEQPQPIQEIKEDRMDKQTIMSELEATKVKLAALEVLAKDCGCVQEEEKTESKEAGKAEMIKCPTCGGKVLKATSYCLACKKKIGGGDKKDEGDKKEEGDKKDEKKEDKKEDKKEASTEKTAMESIVASLDEIAGVLESQKDPELLKIAFQLDMVSDVLEGKKEASTLEGDMDEKYMKQFFHAGTREADRDESYMKAFNTDMTTELNDKFQHKQLGKDASALPYKVVK